MPAIKILDRVHSPRVNREPRFTIALNGFAAQGAGTPVPAAVEPARPGVTVERVFFETCRFAYRLWDFAVALRERWRAFRAQPASTLLAHGAVAIMAAILLKGLIGPLPESPSAAPEPEKRPDWIEISRAQPSFALESSALSGLSHQYQALRHRTGGGRRDIMTFGDADAFGPYARIAFYRPGAEGMAEPDPLEAAAGLAADSGLDADLQETSGKVRTKFGDLPAVNMRVWKKEGWRNCVAVASAWSDPRLGLVAWWCNSGPEMVALGEFACVLDRAALMSAGGDDQLAEFFARAELRRNYCGGQSSFVSPTPRLVNDWIDAKRSPGLRGQIPAR